MRGAARAAAALCPAAGATTLAGRLRQPRSWCRLGEGGLDHAFLGEFVASQVGDHTSIAEHIDAVAVAQLFGLGRVPQEGATTGGLPSDQLINLDLRSDVHAA